MRHIPARFIRTTALLAAACGAFVTPRLAGAQGAPEPLPPADGPSSPPPGAEPSAAAAPRADAPPPYDPTGAPSSGGRAAPPPPYVYTPRPPPVRAPRVALWLGGRAGLLAFAGHFYENERGARETTGNFLGPGLGAELDVGVRFAHRFVPYVFWERGFMTDGNRFGGRDVRATNNFFGLGFRWTLGSPHDVGFLIDVGVGARSVSVSDDASTYRMRAFEIARLGVGTEIRMSRSFVLSPLVTLSSGTMGSSEGTIDYGPVGSRDGITRPRYTGGARIDETRTYVVFSAGLGAHFDLFGR